MSIKAIDSCRTCQPTEILLYPRFWRKSVENQFRQMSEAKPDRKSVFVLFLAKRSEGSRRRRLTASAALAVARKVAL